MPIVLRWTTFRDQLRPWLVLGRISNLPTVWSNGLAAWLLGGGGGVAGLVLAWIGGSLVYVGGMFLNDFCDAAFDREHRTERPIPSGQVDRRTVGWIAAGLIATGWGFLASLGPGGAGLGFLLVLAVVVYDAIHKHTPLSPVLMALCRYCLFLAAATAAADGITGRTVWSALILGAYVIGLSHVARRESGGGVIGRWPLLPLLSPILLAGFVNPPASWGRSTVLVPALLFLLWTTRCLARLWRGPSPEGIRNAVSGLLAGIVWVDVVAVMPMAWPWGGVFLALFGLALILQRLAPAT